MSDQDDFYVRFWGVRGSIACPGPETVRYGGNTSCMEVRCGDQLLIIDGGTGLRQLGDRLAEGPEDEIHLFFTHTHFDHVAGVPFFRPAYMKSKQVHFWAGHLTHGQTIRQVLCDLLIAPLFPVPISVFGAAHYHDFSCGVPIALRPEIGLNTCPLNHPNGACGYRIDFAGKSICIITDTEHNPDALDQTIVDFTRDADIMIYDATYTDEEYPRFVTWGHSTWQEALRIAAAANIRRTVLFHHEPTRTDDALDRIVAAADAVRPGTVAATEGTILRP